MYLQQIKCFKKTYLQQLDPVNDNFMLAVKITLASLITAMLASFFVHAQGMFLILGTILFMITNPDASKKQQLIGILIAGILGAAGVFLATIVNQHLILLLLVTAIFAVSAAYVNRIDSTYGLAGLLAVLLIIIAGGMPGDTAVAYTRMLNCLIGLAIGLLVSFIFLPKNPVRKLKRSLLVLLNDMTEYFYHTSADCLRGNHINPRHWQIKERILLTLNKTRSLIKELNTHTEAAALLKRLFVAEAQLLESLLPLASIMTSPANNAAFINILPALAQFSTSTYNLMRNYTVYLQQPIAITEDAGFVSAVADLQTAINQMVDNTWEKAIIYQWPFDITIFSYLLANFSKDVLNFKKVLLALTQ